MGQGRGRPRPPKGRSLAGSQTRWSTLKNYCGYDSFFLLPPELLSSSFFPSDDRSTTAKYGPRLLEKIERNIYFTSLFPFPAHSISFNIIPYRLILSHQTIQPNSNHSTRFPINPLYFASCPISLSAQLPRDIRIIGIVRVSTSSRS